MNIWEWLSNLFSPGQAKVIPFPLQDDSYTAPWMEIANKELGVQETPGFKNNLRILQYHKVTTLKATEDSVPWCAAAACWCLEQAGYEHTKSARARDFLSYGEKLNKPIYGSIVVFDRGNGLGHVGFFVGWDRDQLRILGGNQKDKFCIETYGTMRVLGYRWPIKRKT